MKTRILTISLLISTSVVGYCAASAPAPAPPAPAPFRPVQPAVVPSAPSAPSAAGQQLPAGNQQIQSGPTFGGTNTMSAGPTFTGSNAVTMVPQNGAQTNALVAPNSVPGATNGSNPQLANTNANPTPFLPATNQFGAFTNQFGGGFSNQFGAFTNRFNGTNMFGFPFSNQFGTNIVLEDEGLTPQDRSLLAQIRMELLPIIRRDRLPIHLISQNGVVTVTGFVLTAQEAQQLALMVQQTPGVTGVNNQLQVNPNFAGQGGLRGDNDQDDQAFSRGDRDLVRDMRGRFRHRHGDRGVSQSVRIIARNGVITLTGFVDSTAEEQALVAAAQTTPGVVSVDDDLQVRGQAGQGTGQQNNTSQQNNTGVGSAFSPSGTSSGNASSGLAPFAIPENRGLVPNNTNNLPR